MYRQLVELENNVKFDFGCGANVRDGYVGVDCRDMNGVGIMADVEGFSEIPSMTASQIRSCHFIEHLTPKEVDATLKNWYRILKNNGRVTIFFPDLSKINPAVDKEIACNHAFGARSHEFDYHKTFWTVDLMIKTLKEYGYKNIREIPYFGPEHPSKGNKAWTSGVEAEKNLMLSIVIATYNDGKNKYINKCIKSVDRNTSFNHEIIVIDTKDPRISVAEAWNKGIEQSIGEIIILLNDDTIVTPEWADDMIDVLYSNRLYGVVSPTLSQCGNNQKDIYKKLFPEKIKGSVRIPQINKMGRIIKEKYKDECVVQMDLCGCCMMFERSLFDKVGKFEPMDSLAYGEENNWLDMVMECGYKLVYAKGVFVYHEGGKTASRVDDIDLKKAKECLTKKRKERKRRINEGIC